MYVELIYRVFLFSIEVTNRRISMSLINHAIFLTLVAETLVRFFR
jgi:hypothetical protein